jgi:hypothetical protein
MKFNLQWRKHTRRSGREARRSWTVGRRLGFTELEDRRMLVAITSFTADPNPVVQPDYFTLAASAAGADSSI